MCLLRLLPLAANFRQNIGHSMSQSIFKKWKIRCLQTSFLFDSQSDRPLLLIKEGMSPYFSGPPRVHGKLLASKGTIVTTTSSVRQYCPPLFTIFSKSSQEPTFGCLASRGGPVSLVCVAALDCWRAHVTLGCRKWLEHTRGIEPAAPAWLTETRVTTKWSEDEREPSFTLGQTQYLNSHKLEVRSFK